MSRVLAVAKREFLFRVKKKSFIILTVLGPVLILLLYSLPVLFLAMSSGGERRVAVADLSGTMLEPLRQKLAQGERLVVEPAAGETPQERGLSFDRRLFAIEDVTVAGESVDAAKERLNGGLANETLDAYLILGPDPDSDGNFFYGSRSSAEVPSVLVRSLTEVVIGERSRRRGLDLDAEQIAALTRRPRIVPIRVSKAGDEVSEGGAQRGVSIGLVWGMSFVFYLTFLIWGSTIIQGVVEEKSSRIVEVLLSSVTPAQFMVGKVAGIGAVALTQLGVWVLCAVGVVASGTAALPQIAEAMQAIDLSLFFWFIVMFFLGFAIYSLLYAAVGAMGTSNQEAQQAAMPVTVMVIVAFFLLFAVQESPDSGLAIFGSLFPLTSPLVMLMRLGISEPPAWQVGLALLLQAGAAAGIAWVAAKVFRIGILMTGKRTTIPELWKALRAG